MVGKTNVAGARLRAVIAVTYPEGSVCTCSNGTKTLKAKDTIGKALFNVTVGEWTVTATDGDKTKSVKVSITQEGQSESVTLRYELVLYRSGDENTAVTGGWTGKPCYPYTDNTSWVITPTITRNSDNIRFYINSGAGGGIVYPANTVDLTDYKILTLKCSTGTIHEGHFCVWKDRPPNNGEGFDYNRAINLVLASSNTYEQTYDISALTGAYSMGFGLFSNQNDTDIYLTELVCT